MITHDGQRIPTDPIRWDPDQIEWITFAWDDQVALRGAIQSSEWVLPDGWTKEDSREDVTAEARDGNEFDHCNQALVQGASLDSGERFTTVTNRVTFADTTTLDRSVRLQVENT